MKKRIRVPATTANLGPGFDALGLALAIWNEVEIEPSANSRQVTIAIEGFGADSLPADQHNLILRAANYLYAMAGVEPIGLHFHSRNQFPGSSGLGSSSSAVLLGLAGANAYLESPLPESSLLSLANELEGHPDNVTPALLGGLTMSVVEGSSVVARKRDLAPGWQVGVVVPDLAIPTRAMRAALPAQISMEDAVFNLSRALMVSRAFEDGDEALLIDVMDDRIHQPYRLPLIDGAAEALDAAQKHGLPGALSGAGPGVIVFSRDGDRIREAVKPMEAAFEARGHRTWVWRGEPDNDGMLISEIA